MFTKARQSRMKTIRYPACEALKQIGIKVELTGARRMRCRIAVGAAIMRFAAFVIGVGEIIISDHTIDPQ